MPTFGFDAGKRVQGRKRHLVTDTLGMMLRIEVHSASVQDRDGAARVLDWITRRFPFLERIFADAGYQGPRVVAAAPRRVEIVKRTDTGFVVQPKRWVIERTFAGPASTDASLVTSKERPRRSRLLPDRHDQLSDLLRRFPLEWVRNGLTVLL